MLTELDGLMCHAKDDSWRQPAKREAVVGQRCQSLLRFDGALLDELQWLGQET